MRRHFISRYCILWVDFLLVDVLWVDILLADVLWVDIFKVNLLCVEALHISTNMFCGQAFY